MKIFQEVYVNDHLPEHAMLVANNTFCFFFFFLPAIEPFSPKT
jgi:hypothetical protein